MSDGSAGTHLVAIESKGLSSRRDAVVNIEILRVQNSSLKSIRFRWYYPLFLWQKFLSVEEPLRSS